MSENFIRSCKINSISAAERLLSALDECWVFRGQADTKWPLLTSLDRMIRQPVIPNLSNRFTFEEAAKKQFETFKDSALGKTLRGINSYSVDEVLAIGQHYGLKTPLLDWSESPYLALFFAAMDLHAPSRYFSVWCVHRDNVERLLHQSNHPVRFEYLRTDENSRIIAQRGCFSRIEGGGCLKSLVEHRLNQLGFRSSSPWPTSMIEAKFPVESKADVLLALRRMNLTWLSVYPDFDGAAKHTNWLNSI